MQSRSIHLHFNHDPLEATTKVTLSVVMDGAKAKNVCRYTLKTHADMEKALPEISTHIDAVIEAHLRHMVPGQYSLL